MKRYDLELADGSTLDDIDEYESTMSHDSAAICSEGHTPLVRSSRKVYCHKCGVWWWSRAEVNNHG